jgi:hypothetical protein
MAWLIGAPEADQIKSVNPEASGGEGGSGVTPMITAGAKAMQEH